jgi:hypothetical protein
VSPYHFPASPDFSELLRAPQPPRPIARLELCISRLFLLDADCRLDLAERQAGVCREPTNILHIALALKFCSLADDYHPAV